MNRKLCPWLLHIGQDTYYDLSIKEVNLSKYVFEEPIKGYLIQVNEKCSCCHDFIDWITYATLNEQQYEAFVYNNSFEMFKATKDIGYIKDWEHYNE